MVTSKNLPKLIVLLTSLFCILSVGSASNLKQIRVGYIPIGDCLNLYVALDLGYFAEENLSVVPVPLASGAAISRELQAGKLDIGWSNSVSVITAYDQGKKLLFVSPGAISIEGSHRTHSLLVARDSKISDFSDLAGMQIAINSFANINDLTIFALADKSGMDQKTLKRVEIPFPKMIDALNTGSAQAILAVEPFVTLALNKGIGRHLIRSAHQCYGERFMIASWFTSRDWILQNMDTTEAFTRAINRANKFIGNNPEVISYFLVKHTKLTNDLIHKITMPAFSTRFNASDLQRMIDMAYKYGFIKQPFSADHLLMIPDNLIESNRINQIGSDINKEKLAELLTQPNSKIVVNLKFGSNSTMLSQDAILFLTKFGQVISNPGFSGNHFRIIGHTDSKGPAEYNQDLSQRRSRTVKDYLIQHFDIEPSMLEIQGKGEFEPLTDLEPEDPANRRLEIFRLD